MIVPRYNGDRGHANHGWLDTYHTFSFAGYHDPRFMGFRVLRVINEDRVAPGQGFGMHPHRDMEIVTYVIKGAIEHRDSMGNGEVLSAGQLQCMSAGTGIAHSEFNPSSSEGLHLYQIWLEPQSRGIEPAYQQQSFPQAARLNRWVLVASSTGREGSLRIHQQADIYLAALEPSARVEHQFDLDRHGWLQVISGVVRINGFTLHAGDGAAISDEPLVSIQAVENVPSAEQAAQGEVVLAEVMLFDLP